ncbi:MAG: cyclase family protein [Nitrososphaeria archaeon]
MSYPISKKTTFLPRSIGPPKIHARSRIIPEPINMGESETRWNSYNNTSILEMGLHTGTHIDFPFHIDSNGFKLDDFVINDFIFCKPFFIEIIKNDLEKILKEELVYYESNLRECDLLFIYTGFSRYRFSDPERYEMKQPDISIEAARYITSFNNIKCIAIDTISIENLDRARPNFTVHKILLCNRKFFIIEDANLEPLKNNFLKKVYAIPLWLLGVEATPVTILAEVE